MVFQKRGVAKMAVRSDLTTVVRAAVGLTMLSVPEPAAMAAQAYAPPGRLVQAGGSLLHVLCTGSGSPTILLEAGAGGNHLDWSLVQPQLARTNKVCSYDRAGFGWSSGTRRSRTVDNIADELHRVAAAMDLAPPFVIVGHSFGGLIALHYAARYGTEVAGLVLLDPAHPDQFQRFRHAGVRLPQPERAAMRTPPTAATYGLPDRLHGIALHLARRPEARLSAFAEMTLLPVNAVRVNSNPLPRVAARIVIHGNREWDGPYPDGRMERAWSEMQADLALRLEAPPPIVALASGHQIALDSPELVVRTVREVIRSQAAESVTQSP
jgi:pimeloyl-ACP methyl ester carboxylesterase